MADNKLDYWSQPVISEVSVDGELYNSIQFPCSSQERGVFQRSLLLSEHLSVLIYPAVQWQYHLHSYATLCLVNPYDIFEQMSATPRTRGKRIRLNVYGKIHPEYECPTCIPITYRKSMDIREYSFPYMSTWFIR